MFALLYVRKIRALLAIFALLVIALPIVLAALTISSAAFTCSSVTFSFSNDVSGGWDEAVVTITNLSTADVVYDSAGTMRFSPYGDGSPYTVNFAPQPAGSSLELTIQVGARIQSVSEAACRAAETNTSGSSSEPGSAPTCPDGRINQYNCEPVAIYPVSAGVGYGMVVYKNIPDGVGVPMFAVSAHELDGLPSHPDAPLLIAASPDGFAALYWLPSDEFQVVAGPDYEGKMFKFIFSEFPGEEPLLVTYMAWEEVAEIVAEAVETPTIGSY